jgi:hypothetical protein
MLKSHKCFLSHRVSLGWPARNDVIFGVHVELVQNSTTAHKSKNHMNFVKFYMSDFKSHMFISVILPWACTICMCYLQLGTHCCIVSLDLES